MVKRKQAEGNDLDRDLTIPIPIQTFLWRQSSPFIRPKLGKLCEASCVSFERVLVQNILHGLSPSLCEAIQSISRWKLIQAAFPHVMQCCAAVLRSRKENDPDAKFTPNETKLLYTLHWIILDAASECEDNAENLVPGSRSLYSYLHSLDAIQLFVFLFAPVIFSLKDTDFQSLKLENGLRLWQPLWDYRQPDVPCFSIPVKAKRVVLKAQRNLLRVNFNTANIYIGKGTSTDNIYLGFDGMESPSGSGNEPSSPMAPIARMSDICAMSSTTATSVEVICEICNQVVHHNDGELSCKCGMRRSSNMSAPDGTKAPTRASSPIDKDYVAKRLESAVTSGFRSSPSPDILSASYFDVAVMRCLFCPQWAEDGVYWGLRYIHQRLLEVCDDYYRVEYQRERSKSLPLPQIQITPPEQSSSTPTSPVAKSSEDIGDLQPKILTREPDKEHRKEPAFKRIRVAELKQILGDKVKQLRRRESQEQFDLETTLLKDESERSSPEHHQNGTAGDPPTRPSSALGKLTENEEDSYEEDKESGDSSSDIVRRKSMPAFRRHRRCITEDEDDDSSGSGKLPLLGKDSVSRTLSLKPELLQKPIITITQDTPGPGPISPGWGESKRGSIMSDRTETMRGFHKRMSFQRSFTDSNISYNPNDVVDEVPGSVFYIQSNGQMNYDVILQAARSVASRECTARVCSVLLNILNCLLDLNVIEKKETKKAGSKSKKTDNADKEADDKQKPPPENPLLLKKKNEKTGHSMAMETILRIFKHVGCPHGCGDGMRGPTGDHLRSQGVQCFTRLMKINTVQFRKYLRNTFVKQPLQDIIDFLHAFLGFCYEPMAGNALSPPGGGSKSLKRGGSQEGGRTGYANNFGKPVDGGPSVEDQFISQILKPLTSKLVENWKDLHNHDNISLYCDVKQLLNYVKELHGGTFRRVALSGLLDAVKRPDPGAEKTTTKTKFIRRTFSLTSDTGEDFRSQAALSEVELAKGRRSLFRKKPKKPVLATHGAVSDSEVMEDGQIRSGRLSPRVSMSANEEDPPSGPTTPKRKLSKFNIAWKRATKSDYEDDSASETSDAKRDSKKDDSSPQHMQGQSRTKGRMSFKAASQATLSFLCARKRIEDGLKNLSKRRLSKRGSVDNGSSRRGSHDAGSSVVTEVIIREKKLVNAYAVKSGMLRFNFMLDCCHPGSVPDPHLIAALLDLEAPVVGRATLLMECAYFVNRCNRGDWPNWMKLNLPGFRQPGLHVRGQPSGYRRNLILQRAAGKMFHQWGEAISNRMWDIVHEENPERFTIIHQVKDDSKKKELRIEDDEEDFLDEATCNHSGSDCPYALKMVACQLLLEITTFLRETYQYLPKTRTTKKESVWEKHISSRRWSVAPSSPVHSDRSNSRSSQGDGSQFAGSPGDRKISFAVFGQGERSDSLHSSTTTISQLDTGDGKGRRLATGRKLLKKRRGSGHNSSFRHNRSFRFKRAEGGSSMKGSLKTRKVSTQSLQSHRSEDEQEHSNELGSDGMLSDEAQEPCDQPEQDEQDYCKYMPWIKVIVLLANTSNFICDHQNFCHPNCYERQRRSCSRLMTAVKKIYTSNESDEKQLAEKQAKKDFRDKLKRRDNDSGEESMFQPSSPTHRRESTPLLEKIKSDTSLSKVRLAAVLEKKEAMKKPCKPKDELPIMKYIKTQVQNLTHSPMAIISKSAPILSNDTFVDMMPVAWELLLESDQELAAAAATVFILSSVKASDRVQELMTRELQHNVANQRINAILRFGVLWRFRWQVWPRMEDGANVFFKVPPPSIDFVLPSPTIGLPSLIVIDPPWTPHFKTKVEEVTINQEESKSFVTATTTRRKQQQEMIHKALLAEEDRKRAARENFHVTGIAIKQLASYEPALHHASEDHEEALVQDEIQTLAARRMSVAPINRASNFQIRNMSGRHGSLFWARPTVSEGEEERVEHLHSHHMQLAQHFFPSCICAAAVPLLYLLDDLEVTQDGIAVCEVADKVTRFCLVEEPALFLRTFLEKLTQQDKQEELIFLLRKMLQHFRQLPAQTAHCLFNYLVGFVMFYVRSPAEGGQEAISEALSILWQIVPSVHGVFFKDLKQTLRKEQCDPTLLITANVPSAKKLIVHGPDLSSIPSQFPILEDTQFSMILQDSLDFFNIPDNQHSGYFLVDTKTNQMHNLNSYVRDFYFFRRNHYPQLSLIHLNPDEASKALQKQALTLKFVEMGKVLFTLSVLQGSSGQQMQNHVSWLHEELLKLPSFPRKALESEFGLHKGELGKEVYGMDMLHKYAWTKLMGEMFQGMSSTMTWAGDLPLFLNVINGTLILHAEDTAMMRLSLSTFISSSRHFKQVFATSGFLFIMPTLLKVYSNHQANLVVCEAIEFVCKQFFLLHRNPFILQMFGSVAPILDMTEDRTAMDTSKIDPEAMFNLLLSLEKDAEDSLDILELLDGEKPLTALDFCYIEDPDTFTVIDSINLCITVVAYACDSARAVQMLTILEAIIPYYLRHIKSQTTKKDNISAVREELNVISNLAISMRALVGSCEPLTRNFSGPQRQLESVSTNVKATQNHSNHSPQTHGIYYDEHSDIRYTHMEEGLAKRRHLPNEDHAEFNLKEFRRPRNSLLCVIAEFLTHCSVRLRELRRALADPNVRAPELLDHKAHTRLADVAHTLLKVAPYDPATMKCRGVQRYIIDILPITDWSQEVVRPALNLILRRLERLFSKMYKKPVLRRHLDWEAAANLLRGVYNTLARFTYVAHLPHLKTLINVCLNIVLSEDGGMTSGDSSSVGHRSDSFPSRTPAPPAFSSAIIKLAAMQMQALGEHHSLEHICGGTSVFPNMDKTANMLINLILPLCIRVGSGRRDAPKIRPPDVIFALSVVLNALVPPTKQQSSHTGSKTHHLSVSDIHRSGSLSSHTYSKRGGPREFLLNVAFLGLKIVVICFEKQLATEWYRIAKCTKDLGNKLLGGVPLWRFLDFIVTIRTPLFMMLQPFIQYKMMKVMCETEQEYFLQQMVHQKMQGHNMPHPKCKGAVLIELATELRNIKEELSVLAIGDLRSRAGTVTDKADVSRRSGAAGIHKASSIHDILEQQVGAKLQILSSALPGTIRNRGGFSSVGSHGKPSTRESPELAGPALRRKSSARILATEGSRILDKFFKKATVPDDDAPVEATYRRSTSLRKLYRQPSIYQRGALKQAILTEEAIPEEDEEEEPTKPVCPPKGISTPPFQRRSRVIRRGILRWKSAISMSINRSDSRVQPNRPMIRIRSATDLRLAGDVSNGDEEVSTDKPDGVEVQSPTDPRVHRLQRQDAKSRKTFKIKRHRSTIKGNIIRSATMKASLRPKTPVGKSHSGDLSGAGCFMEMMETQPEEPEATDTDVATAQTSPKPASLPQGRFTKKSQTSDPGALNAVPDQSNRSRPSSRPRYITKSRSHDDGTELPASAGTARGRIARHGARSGTSRSPSTSPARCRSLNTSPTQSLNYGTPKSDSTDSLLSQEESALLQDEDQLHAHSSLILLFEGQELQDTCV